MAILIHQQCILDKNGITKPFIRLEICENQLAKDTPAISALIDTGFNKGVILPDILRSRINPEYLYPSGKISITPFQTRPPIETLVYSLTFRILGDLEKSSPIFNDSVYFLPCFYAILGMDFLENLSFLLDGPGGCFSLTVGSFDLLPNGIT